MGVEMKIVVPIFFGAIAVLCFMAITPPDSQIVETVALGAVFYVGSLIGIRVWQLRSVLPW